MKSLDRMDHASIAMQYWETSMKIDRAKAVLKKVKVLKSKTWNDFNLDDYSFSD